jgi:drug/metabolite transporter (DMT)-like permease
MNQTSRDYRLSLLLVTAAVVAWSTAGLFTRSIAADTPTVLFWRGVFGAVGTCLVIALVPRTGGLASFSRLGWAGAAYAVVTAVSMLFFISSLRHTTVAHVAVITATVPFAAAWLGWIVLREVPGRTAIMASAMALIGVAAMVGVSAEGRAFGDFLAGFMALCMAGMILISRKFPSLPALPATCIASLLSAVFTLPLATLTSVTYQDFSLLLLFALVNQVLGFGFFAMGARYLPPIETALLTALEAPLAPLWVWLVFGETLGRATLIGGAMVLAAVIGHMWWMNHTIRSTSSS